MRARRLGDQIMRELAEMLATEIQDPRLELVTISGVRLNPNMRVAEVLYTAGGGEEHLSEVAQALDKAKGWLRRELGHRLKLRFVPELRFSRDTFLEDVVYGQGTDTPNP